MHAFDITRGAELLKVAADRHLRDAKRIRNLLDRDGAMGVQKRLHVLVPFRFDHVSAPSVVSGRTLFDGYI